ncbi:MAG: beta-lactamase family protein [Clostridiales bacterium]|nr:beta-lactamase family protein [Clostridiales bacterium]
MKLKKGTGTAVCISLIVVIIIMAIWRKELSTLFSSGSYNDVDSMVETMMNKSTTPGVGIVLSKQGEIEYKCYGYADEKNHKNVNDESLFELASTTKAFTALAIILLEEEGYLASSDSITDYLSWFTPTYNGEHVNITIDQVLAHTSGIPSWSIRLIPEGTSDDMLEKTIRNISNITLDTYPGTKHSYATINYDVLALIIEEVTGQRYQDFVTDNILLPLGMTESYFSTGQENVSDKLTKGYKVFFGKSIEYNAPRYYGNIAAGYLVTNVKDLGFWLNAQLGIGDIPNKLKRAINRSHEVNKETAGYEDTNNYYSYGWSNDIEAKVINHNASNPNYSAQVIIDLEKQEAIFVLANLNSSVPTQIAYNIYEHMNGKQMSRFSYDDFNILLDLIFLILTIIVLVSLCIKIINLTKQKKQTIKNENTRSYKMGRLIIGLVLRIILLVLIIIWPYLLNYNYHFIRVWMPNAILAWEFLAVINCVLSIITKLRKIVVIRKKNVFIEGSTGTLNEN